MVVNVSAGKSNYSQRNNIIRPMESCNVTSMVMALDYMGYRFPVGHYEQPEDNLRKFMEDNGKNSTIHADLSECTNKWMGHMVTDFRIDRKISDILDELWAGRPVVISGTFPGFPTKRENPLGHIVCLVGAEWPENNRLGYPKSVLWDDPYGNTLDNWKGSGNDIKVDFEKFINWIKPVERLDVKWGHFFYK